MHRTDIFKKKPKKKQLYICSKTIKNLNNQGAFSSKCILNATPLQEGAPWQIKTALIHEDVLSMSSAAIYHHPISQSRGDTPRVNHPCSGLNCWTLIIESGLVENKKKCFPRLTQRWHILYSSFWRPLSNSYPLQQRFLCFRWTLTKIHFPSSGNVKGSL